MNTKKNSRLLGGLMLAGCFMMITQPAAAQSWGGGVTGIDHNGYTINNDDSNHWSYLRLQTDDDRGWNIVNSGVTNDELGSLWWGFAPNGNSNDQGMERMRLTNDGRLTLTKPTANDPAGLYFKYDGNAGVSAGIQADRDFGGANNGGLQLLAYNTRPIQFLTKNGLGSLTSADEAMRITGEGYVGIGTTSPATTLDVAGIGHFGDKVGIGITTPERSLHIRGDVIRLDRDGNSPGIQLVRYAPDYTSVWKTFQFHTESSGSNNGKFIISDRGNTTNGVATSRFTIDNDGDIGIGTTSPSAKLHVEGTGHFSQDVGIGTDSPERSLHVRGDVIRIDRDAPNPAFQLVRYDPGYVNVWKTFELSTESSGANDGKFIIADRGTTTASGGAIPRLTIDNDGNIGIGTSSPTAMLEVSGGTVKANSFTSSAGSFPDYVFEEDYTITPLAELERYVKANKHLPNMPSEKEVVEQGLNIPEVVTKSVENIEVIYLHLIRMEKKIEALEQENNTLKQQLKQGL